MTLKPIAGFVLVEAIDEWLKKGALYLPTIKAFQNYFVGRVIAVGEPTISYDGKKFYDTSEVKENDIVICVFDEVVAYPVFTGTQIKFLYKVPVYSVLAVIENSIDENKKEGKKDDKTEKEQPEEQ